MKTNQQTSAGHVRGSARMMLLASAALVALPAHAQAFGDEAGASDVQPAEQAGGLQEIVVTARKRQESLQDVPASVTALTAEQLDEYDLTSLEKVATLTPNFVIARASNGSGAQLSLRGVGSNYTSIGIEQSVATIVDGVYYGQGRIINEAFFDMERVEVLKGPQSLFYGKNSTAGVVSLTTADPTSTPEFIVRAGYEFEAEEMIGEFVGSGPISDTLGVRLAVRGSNMSGGYVKNVAGTTQYTTTDIATGDNYTYPAPAAASEGPGDKSINGRLTLRWEPDDRLTVKVKGSGGYSRNDSPSWNYVIFDCPSGLSFAAAGQPCGKDFVIAQNGYPEEIAKVYPLSNHDGGLSNEYWSYGVTAGIDYELPGVTINSVTNYFQFGNTFVADGDYFTSDNNVWTNERDHYHQFSSELRALTTSDGPVNLMIGGYYQKTHLEIYNVASIGNVEDTSVPAELRYLAFDKSSGTHGKTLSAYGQVIWEVIPDLELTGGVRYIHETKDSFFVHPYVNDALQGVFREGDYFTADQTFNNWSPEVTATWSPSSKISVYAAYKTGFKSGGFSNTSLQATGGTNQDLVFRPEKAKGFEGGVKMTLFDRQLRLNIGAYSYEYNDLQLDFFNSTTVAFITTNAGAATTKGIEMDFEAAPYALPNLTLRGSLNYNKARYKDYLAPCVAGQSISEGCNVFVAGGPFQNLDGLPTGNAPEWTGSFSASYEIPLSTQFDLQLSSDVRYSSSYLASSFANDIARQPKYASLGAIVSLTDRKNDWELAFIGKNLTNQFILTGSYDVAGTGSGTGTENGVRGNEVGLVMPPRTLQVRLTKRF